MVLTRMTITMTRRRHIVERLGRYIGYNDGKVVANLQTQCRWLVTPRKEETVIVMEDEGWMQKLEWKDDDKSYDDVLKEANDYPASSLSDWQDLSDLYWKLGKYSSCWDAQWQHWLLLQNEQDLLKQAQCMNRLGCILMQLQDYDEAKKWLDQSLQYKEKYYSSSHQEEGQVELGKSYNSLALWYLQQDDDEQGLVYLDQAEQHYRFSTLKTDAQTDEYGSICQNLATLYRQNLQFEKALKFYQQAYELFLSPDKKIEMEFHLGDIYYALERYNEAAEQYEDLLKRSSEKSSQSILHLNLGRVHAQSGRHEFAMNHYQQSLDNCTDKYQEASIYNAMGALYAILEAEEITALRYFNMALEIYNTLPHTDVQDEMQYTQANIQRVQQSLFTTPNNNK